MTRPPGIHAIPAHITYFPEMDQGSEDWLAARCGMLTASEVKLIMTATGKVADNDKTRAHVYELAAQRLTGFVEPRFISDDMLRGHEDEVEARIAYEKAYGGTATTPCASLCACRDSTSVPVVTVPITSAKR